MKFENAKYMLDFISGEVSGISAEVSGQSVYIPIDANNTHYAELMRQVDEAELEISDADPIEPQKRRVGTPREFLELFSDAEQAAFFAAESANVELKIWWAKASTGSFSLDHPSVADGLAGLVAAGILSQERSNEILASDFDQA